MPNGSAHLAPKSISPPDWIERAWSALYSRSSFSMRPRRWQGAAIGDPPSFDATPSPSEGPSSIVFGISSDYGDGLLLHLLRAGHVPSALVTSTRFGHAPEDCFYEQAAHRLGIPLLAGENVHAPEIQRVLKALAPDIAWVFSFDQIFKPSILEIPRLGMINFHPSLLPHHRGPEPLYWQIAEGEAETGMTASTVTEGIDAGPILGQTLEEIRSDDSAGTLARRVVGSSEGLIRELLERAGAGELEGPAPTLAEGSYESGVVSPRLDFRMPAAELERIVRAALADDLSTIEDLDGRRFRVKAARVIAGSEDEGSVAAVPGTVLEVTSEGLPTIATFDGALEILAMTAELGRFR